MNSPVPDPVGLVRAVLAAEPGLDATTIADLVWLAAHTAPVALVPPKPLPSRLLPDPAGADASGPVGGASPGTQPSGAALFDLPGDGGPDKPVPPSDAVPLGDGRPPTTRGRRIGIPSPAGLPDALNVIRALRPFNRAWPRGVRPELDIDETVRRYAATLELVPMFRPAPERWFDLEAIVDNAPSMAVWRATTDALVAAIRQAGVFGSVIQRSLDGTGSRLVLRNASGREVPPRLLQTPDARRLIVIISDCAADCWYNDRTWAVVGDWASRAPTVLVNPLRSKYWRATGMNLPAARLFAAAVGGANWSLRFETPTGGFGATTAARQWTPVPALALSARSIGQWARMLMRRDPNGVDGILLHTGLVEHPYQEEPYGEDLDDRAPLTPAQRVKAFELVSSRTAFRLASLCTPFPSVSLGVVTLLRDTLLPEAGVNETSELIVGGLFDVVTDGGEPALRFKHGVREHMLPRLAREDAWRTYQALSSYLERRLDRPGRMSAFIHDLDGAVDLPADLVPFAEATRHTLQTLGVAPRTEPADYPAPPVDATKPSDQPEPASEPLGSPYAPTEATAKAPERGELRRSPLPPVLDGGLGVVRSVRFSPDGRYVLAAGRSGLAIWQADRGWADTRIESSGRGVRDVACSPNGSMIAIAHDRRPVEIVELGSLKTQHRLSPPDEGPRSVCFSPNGRVLAGRGSGGTVRRWSVSTGEALYDIRGPGSIIRALAFDGGANLLTGGDDGVIRLWRGSNGELLRTYAGPKSPVRCIAAAPSGRRMAVFVIGGDHGTVRVYTYRDARSSTILSGHRGSVTAVAYAPDGRVLASASDDGQVRIWDTSTGRHLRTLTSRAAVLTVCFSPDGRHLAWGGAEGVVRIWPVPTSP